MTHGSLFAGIGGFDLGFERAGIKTVWQVEIDPFCRKVLEKHWPNVQRFNDINQVDKDNLAYVGIVSGGFPCQDISNAGRRKGIDGERSGLWREYLRIICELRPRYAVLENVSALLHMGLGRILGELAEVGYDAEWDCLPAVAFGAPHIRDRIWILAYPMRRHGSPEPRKQQEKRPAIFGASSSGDVADADNQRELQPQGSERNIRRRIGNSGWWDSEPDVGRVAHGIPRRVDRLKGLGNAVVPQIAEWIGRRILEADGREQSEKSGMEPSA